MATKQYIPANVSAAFMGEDLTAFADGTMITVTPLSDLVTYVRGSRGEFAYTRSPDRGATITFTLLQNSPSNTFMYALLQAADELGGDMPMGAFVIQDRSSPSLPILSNCVITKRPERSWSSDQTSVTWELVAEIYEEVPQTNETASFLSKAASGLAAYNTFKDFLETLGL